MTLLSKTLRSLLSKYITDVDVEGVNLTLTSGWGVRLRNVKLRDGIKLKSLPGKLPKRKKNRKEKVKVVERVDPDSEPDPEGNEEEPKAETEDTPPPRKKTSWFSYLSFSSAKEEEEVIIESTKKEPSEEEPHDELPDATEPDSKDEEPSIHDFLQEEVEEILDDDLKVILRLGRGGTIGTLDVRLIGKDIHVLIEDALVTVEVVRLAHDGEGEGDDKGNAEAKQKKPMPDPKTVGERIIAENRLARLFSMIPNLFLRDIRLRIVVREEVVATNAEQIAEQEPDYSNHDAMVELSIEYLSVTDGTDPMARFQTGEEESFSEDEASDDTDTLERAPSTAYSSEETPSRQEYLTKHIKSGRGPEGGIVLKIYPPGESGVERPLGKDGSKWARNRWVSSTEMCVLRLSGLDAHTRIFTGTKKGYTLIDAAWYQEDMSKYDVDALLFGGVDYIVPGPEPTPLPPIDEQEILDDGGEPVWRLPNATVYDEDENGILSSPVPSTFHRFARGLVPEMCGKDHLPCEYCSRCWRARPGTKKVHELDNYLPMPGLVLSISLRDRLELNIDRKSLDTIQLILGLLRKEEPIPIQSIQSAEMYTLHNESLTRMTGIDESERSLRTFSAEDVDYTPLRANESMHSQSIDESGRGATIVTPSLKRNPSLDKVASRVSFDEKTLKNEKGRADVNMTRRGPQMTTTTEESVDGSVQKAFPKSMQPEKIQVVGLYAADILIRIHVLDENGTHESESTFRYWEISSKCLTIDQQKTQLPDKSFQDLRFDLGYASAFELVGIEKRHLFTLGVRQRVVEFDEMTIQTLMTKEENNMRSPWPNTATSLLDLQVPIESLVYEDRERHAFQLRLITSDILGDFVDMKRNHFNARVGAMNIDAPFVIKDEARTILGQIRDGITGPRKNSASVNTMDAAMDVNEVDNIMKYKVILDGGQLRLRPRLDVKVPLTKLSGERSSEAGISFDTVLERVAFSYGEVVKPTIMDSGTISIDQFVALPENVRLRILLFLDDLSPLEKAVCAKRDKNDFLRSNTVNKQMVKIARRRERRGLSRAGDDTRLNRRQEIMSELLRLDDDALESIWDIYELEQKKKSRR